jgi:hypothetical protein
VAGVRVISEIVGDDDQAPVAAAFQRGEFHGCPIIG